MNFRAGIADPKEKKSHGGTKSPGGSGYEPEVAAGFVELGEAHGGAWRGAWRGA